MISPIPLASEKQKAVINFLITYLGLKMGNGSLEPFLKDARCPTGCSVNTITAPEAYRLIDKLLK